ncbi:hypothetical protein SRB5_55690 [Streptomyces sp. RB5]|uniref:Prenyltransferase n=1 Tax=Streptomyces smaragdinus TaxID=2585196 RepID=A0A7K0CPG9_9ACTN|nr:hypothetical protein [Streptomyces smaragdinus]MQY15390.1 hypothetical protein [Streptomyces smaragdinus]
MAPASTQLARAERFMWLTARVLEQRRYAYHFRTATSTAADAVEAALEAYRNPDGGYGHALEPDLRGPVSQPLHTVLALRVLDAVGRCEGRRAERVCGYLTEISTPDGALPAVHPAPVGYPHASLLAAVNDSPPGGSGSLLTTGPVVGTLNANGVWHAWLFRAADFCWQAVESLEATHPYEVQAAVAFLDTAPDRARAEAAAARLGRLVRVQRLAVLDPERAESWPRTEGYAPGEQFYVPDFAHGPDSLARRWFTDAELTAGLDFLAAEQQPDGGWPLRWRARAPGSALEWRPILTLEALLTLRAFGRLAG